MVAFPWVALVIVVVEKQGIGVCLMRILERAAYILVVAADFVEQGFPQRLVRPSEAGTALADGLVEHIPAISHILIAIHDSGYMLFHPCKQDLFRHEVVVIVIEHPITHL